jgi:hypothetical protein
MIYENYMNYFKEKYTSEEYKKKEMQINVSASFIAGSIAAAVTNPLEMITVNKQTNKDFKVKEFIKSEGLLNICT